eukprot:gene25323-10977_t
MLVGIPLASVFIVSWIITGSFGGSLLMCVVLASMLLHLLGAMLLSDIQVNAVSMVNLAMSLGIGVEFCAHVIHAFGIASGTRPQRVAAALEHTGASVLSGGLYLALVFVGAWHGLVLLPVILCLAGPSSWHS